MRLLLVSSVLLCERSERVAASGFSPPVVLLVFGARPAQPMSCKRTRVLCTSAHTSARPYVERVWPDRHTQPAPLRFLGALRARGRCVCRVGRTGHTQPAPLRFPEHCVRGGGLCARCLCASFRASEYGGVRARGKARAKSYKSPVPTTTCSPPLIPLGHESQGGVGGLRKRKGVSLTQISVGNCYIRTY